MNSDGIVRVTIAWTKKDNETLRTIDQSRGKLSRSKAIQRVLRYVTQENSNTFKGIIANDYLKKDKIITA